MNVTRFKDINFKDSNFLKQTDFKKYKYICTVY